LSLVPLDRISDEDAIEVAKIVFTKCGEDASGYTITIVRTEGMVEMEHEGGDISLIMSPDAGFCFYDNTIIAACEESDYAIPVINQIPGMDYLRSKSYNCGYGDYTPQDLIDAGVVITEKK